MKKENVNIYNGKNGKKRKNEKMGKNEKMKIVKIN